MEILGTWESFSGDVVFQGGDCALSDRDCSFFPSFTKTSHESVVEIKVSLAERDDFGGAQAGGIHELEYRVIAKTIGISEIGDGKQLLYFPFG